VHISARVDYAVRTMIQIAAAGPDGSVKADAVARAQDIPGKVLETVLADLRRGGLLVSRRGPEGGYRLARPAAQISLADVIRVVDGPLVGVRGESPEKVAYRGAAEPLQRVWIAARASLRTVLEGVSIAEIATGELPAFVFDYTADPRAWQRAQRP
jgi:Rrf2 family protein